MLKMYLKKVSLILMNLNVFLFLNHWTIKQRKKYSDSGIQSLKDTHREASGRTRKTELTPEQQIAKLNAKISLLEEENNLLKKSEWRERKQVEIFLKEFIY